MSKEPIKSDYIKVFGNLAQKGINLYGKYNEYQKDPEKFKTENPELYITFTTAKDTFNTIRQAYAAPKSSNNSNNSNSSNNDYKSDSDRYYEILESKKTDSVETIKLNYKRLVKDFHPDKISSKDLPKAFVDFAHQRFNEIQDAYEYIKLERKI